MAPSIAVRIQNRQAPKWFPVSLPECQAAADWTALQAEFAGFASANFASLRGDLQDSSRQDRTKAIPPATSRILGAEKRANLKQACSHAGLGMVTTANGHLQVGARYSSSERRHYERVCAAEK
jgi:hypothetical protein